MDYKRLPFEQYFIDQSLGNYGGKPITTVEYKRVIYTGHAGLYNKIFKPKYEADYCVMFNEAREVYQIYFKETCTKMQWVTNFNFPSKYYDSFQYKGKDIQLKAARGWSELYCALKWYIRNELSALIKEHGKHEIEVVGFSLGSGIAMMCCQDLHFNFNIKPHCFTFGSTKPWFGKDKAMKEYLKDCCTEIYNFSNINDIVTYLPCLPKYFKTNNVKVATDKFNIFKLFKARKYHTSYFDSTLYKDIK